jgi:predicted  nucleic acid-binding Zn-ribbon protein
MALQDAAMTSVIDLYEQLSSAPDDRARARVIAEAFEHMEQRYPEVTDLATGTALRETELRLQKEIEQLRGEVHKEIEQLRAETREMEGRLQKEIEQLRGDVQKEIGEIQRELLQMRSEMRQMDHRLQKEIAQTQGEIIKWTVTWTGGCS